MKIEAINDRSSSLEHGGCQAETAHLGTDRDVRCIAWNNEDNDTDMRAKRYEQGESSRGRSRRPQRHPQSHPTWLGRAWEKALSR